LKFEVKKMKKTLLLLMISFVALAGCETDKKKPIVNDLPQKGSVEQGDIMIYPKSEYGYIGDPMPFSSDDRMNMFYLLDERRGSTGFHPFALLTTTNFYEWEDYGTVIPYENSISSQDLALGTGSVIQDKDGLYHAFYTGWNARGEMEWFEKIQHATSTDMITWEKHPEDGFYGAANDFRDPYVYFVETSEEYWMLITSRDYTGGIIKRYTSTDLVDWEYKDIFFRNDDGHYNLECPTLIKYNDYYYLSFSEQGSGNDRVVHYRYTDDIDKGFIKPDVDNFDGWGFYAGRIELFNSKLILSGWVATKTADIDQGDYMWAGHLVTHQIVQNDNGLLHVKILDEIDQKLSNEVNYNVVDGNTVDTETQMTFLAQKGYSFILYEELLGKATKTEFSVDISEASNFGITLNAYESNIGDLNVYFNIEENKLEFYKIDANQIKDARTPEISIFFNYDNITSLDCKLVTEGDVLVLYVNNERALTSRGYNMAGSNFGFFTLNSNAVLTDVHFYE